MVNKILLDELKKYVAYHLHQSALHFSRSESEAIYESMKPLDLQDYVTNHQKPTFQELLFQFIDQKGTSDATIYKKAWLDRRHFSKIRSNPDYQIGKNTVIALIMALELSQEQADKLLHAAGFTLSDSSSSDLVIQFCLKNQIYNLHDVNAALDHLNLKPLIDG